MTDTAPDTGNDATDTSTDEATDTATDDTDWQKEAEKWKTQARKHEERAKANAAAQKELDTLRRASMDDLEKAVDIARSEAKAEALRDVAGKLVDAEVRAAVAGRDIDADALLDGLDRSRFVTEDGDADRDSIVTWVDRIAPKPQEQSTKDLFQELDLGQGRRNRDANDTALNGDPLLKAVTARLKS